MEEPACDTAGASTGGFISYPMLPNRLLRYFKDSGWDLLRTCDRSPSGSPISIHMFGGQLRGGVDSVRVESETYSGHCQKSESGPILTPWRR
jgi:hypothetical protein